MNFILSLFPALEDWLLERKRLHMLKNMLWEVDSGLEPIDYLFGHDQHWVRPEMDGRIIDGRGYLILHVRPKYHNRSDIHYWFSVWQVGTQLKIGVILEGGCAEAPILEGQNEIESIFPDAKTELHDRDGSVMYQWTWRVDGMYDSWMLREKYIRNFRHLYYRMGRIIHDGTI